MSEAPKARAKRSPDTTAAQRKAAERLRLREAGLAPLEVWAPKHLHPDIRKAVAEMIAKDALTGAPPAL